MPDRAQMLQKINEISFVVNDLSLYLDTHPTDKEALAEFQKAMAERKELLSRYAAAYEPLTVDCICPNANNETESGISRPGEKHFTWSDGPLPWDGGAL